MFIITKPVSKELLKDFFNKNKEKKNTNINNKIEIHTYMSVITLNVNGLNAPIKRHRVAEWIQRPTLHRRICID